MTDDLPDHTNYSLIKATDESGNVVTVLVDASGRIVSVMTGDYSGATKTLAVDSAGRMITVIRDPVSNNYISVDSDGNIVSVIKGDSSGTLKTIKVTTAGELISVLKGASGYDVAVDSAGRITVLMKGIYDSTPTTVKLDSNGHIISVMKGEYSSALHTVKLDAEHRMIARVIGSVDDTVTLRKTGTGSGSTDYLLHDAVPSGKLHKITSVSAHDADTDCSTIRFMILASSQLYIFHEDINPNHTYYSTWNGEIWLKEGQQIRIGFYTTVSGDPLSSQIIGAEIDAE